MIEELEWCLAATEHFGVEKMRGTDIIALGHIEASLRRVINGLHNEPA